MNGIGIKYQLGLTTLIPVFLVSVLFAVFYNGQFEKDLSQHTARLGRAYIRQLLPAVELAMMRKDARTLQGLINASTVNPEITALAFYDATGHLIAYRGGKHSIHSPFKPPEFTGNYIEARPIKAHLVNFISPITIPKFNLYDDAFKIAEIIPLEADNVLGWLSIDINTQAMLIKRYQMVFVTIVITLIGLLASLIIHFFFSKRIYLPITRLRRSLIKIKNNVFDTPLIADSKGELGDIEQGCLHLQKQYLNAVQELNQHIEVATADLQQNLESLEEANIELSLERKKIEEKSRQKSEFIANMSHEIRTPMNSVIGFTNVLLESKLDVLQRDYVKTIQASAHDLLHIINDILDYSKMDAGKLKIDCIPVDLRACIDEVLTLAAPNAHKKGIDLIASTNSDVPRTVLGDPLRIKQILNNLVSNAIKFTDTGYVLVQTSIEYETENTYTFDLCVTDTGMGISKEDQTKLFNAFNQADTSITRRFGGSGLGLVICQKLAEAMHGRIVLTSELHQGSIFSIRITLEKLAAYELEKRHKQVDNKLKAICFDTHALELEALCNGLAYLGINCLPVSTLDSLKDKLSKPHDFALAFINVNEGCEQDVANLLTSQTMPCILTSKWLAHHHDSLSAHTCLYKPISIQKLQSTLEHLSNPSQSLPHISPKLQDLRQELSSIYPEILIAEDNPVNRKLLKSLLEGLAHIETVDNGEEALTACQKKHYQILLFDLQMPKLNGLEAAARIRQTALLNKSTPILILTANTGDLDQVMLRDAGITAYLQKPLDEGQLLTHIIDTIKQFEPIIDWPLCLQKVSGNQDLAKEYLHHFVDELVLNKQEFQQLQQQQDLAGLADLAHKLYGACCFCGVPRLQNQVSRLEKQAKLVENMSDLSLALNALFQAIDDLINDYAISQHKIKEHQCQ